jgi:CRISPR-associated Csx10 family RAMP protein
MDGEVVRAGMQLAQLTEDKRVADPGSLPGGMNVLDRILTFNQAAYAVEGLDKERRDYWYFTLNMQSDAILGDARGPRHCPRPADLEMPASVEWVWSGAGYSQAGGWSAAWGLPKRVAPSVTAGSTFVYRVPHGDEDLAQQVLKRCVALEQEGIGQRREEGLGWVQICTPFHLETEVQK